MTPTMDATTRRLVDFALAYRFEDLPASTVHAAKARLLDSAAVGLAAYAAPPVRILRKCAPRVVGPAARTPGGVRRAFDLRQAAVRINLECRDTVNWLLIGAGAYVVVGVDKLILSDGGRSQEQGYADGREILHGCCLLYEVVDQGRAESTACPRPVA